MVRRYVRYGMTIRATIQEALPYGRLVWASFDLAERYLGNLVLLGVGIVGQFAGTFQCRKRIGD